MKPSSDVAFSESVKDVQRERGSRSLYARVERGGGFPTKVDADLRAFLAGVDTAFLATSNAVGQPYIQHRGGPKGFIKALDEHTLGFVDFVGNRQYVTTGNLRDNDRVCLFLIDYEKRGRIKVWGTARMTPATPQLTAQLADPTYRARTEQILLLTVQSWDTNCPKHIPQKLDAREVAERMAVLRARIEELEAEVARIKLVADGGKTKV